MSTLRESVLQLTFTLILRKNAQLVPFLNYNEYGDDLEQYI